MSTSKKTFALSLLIMAVVISFAFAWRYIGSAKAQGKVKRTISEIKFYPSSVIPPVIIHTMRVRGKQVEMSTMFEEGNRRLEKTIKPEEEFEEQDDFCEHIKFDAANRSEKKITYVRFRMYFYTQEGLARRTLDTAIEIDYGPAKYGETPNRINPGERATISIPEEMLPELRMEILRVGGQIVRVGVYVDVIHFEDGTMWNWDGSVKKISDMKRVSYVKWSNERTYSRIRR